MKTGAMQVNGATDDPLLALKHEELKQLQREHHALLQELALTQAGRNYRTSEERKQPSVSEGDLPMPIAEDLSTYAGKKQKLLSYIPLPAFESLRDLFITYASIQNILTTEYLDLGHFHRFLKEFRLYTPRLTKTKAELLFFKNNATKSISFWRFVEILAEFARGHYRSASGIGSLERYLRDQVFPVKSTRVFRVPLEEWEEQLRSPDAAFAMSSNHGLLKNLFKVYQTLDTKHNSKLYILDFLTMLGTFHVIPELLTKPEAVRLFRQIPTEQFAADYIPFEEFKKCFTFLAMFIFTPHPAHICLHNLTQWINHSSELLRVMLIEGRKGMPA